MTAKHAAKPAPITDTSGLPAAPFKHREAWLHAAAERLKLLFEPLDVKIPDVKISCGWSKRAGKNSIGWCWHAETAADGVNQIYVSPELDDPVQVLGVLLHEMVHASDNGQSKHTGHFRRTALAVGLTGKMTATVPTPELAVTLTGMASGLGAYPHAKISPGLRMMKQGTRMIKLSCPCCGYTVRTTAKWLDEGMPQCPHGTEMELG